MYTTEAGQTEVSAMIVNSLTILGIAAVMVTTLVVFFLIRVDPGRR